MSGLINISIPNPQADPAPDPNPNKVNNNFMIDTLNIENFPQGSYDRTSLDSLHSIDMETDFIKDESRDGNDNNQSLLNLPTNYNLEDLDSQQYERDSREFPIWQDSQQQNTFNCWCQNDDDDDDYDDDDDDDDDDDEIMKDVEHAMSTSDGQYSSDTQLPLSDVSPNPYNVQQQKIQQNRQEREEKTIKTRDEARGFWSSCCGTSWKTKKQ